MSAVPAGGGADHPVHQLIYHCASVTDWVVAQATGEYTISSRGRTLAQEGFVHASFASQVPGVLQRFYADVTEPLCLLVIDPRRLRVPVVAENLGKKYSQPAHHSGRRPAAG